ncbi:hypothetical protein LSAT2_028586 [Lamellibrachia satsuma]|nr:hypothetical protein LSAT2_028586 [Lamellibrachia satsuma]
MLEGRKGGEGMWEDWERGGGMDCMRGGGRNAEGSITYKTDTWEEGKIVVGREEWSRVGLEVEEGDGKSRLWSGRGRDMCKEWAKTDCQKEQGKQKKLAEEEEEDQSCDGKTVSNEILKGQIMLLQLLCAVLFLSVVATGDDTLYFKPKHSNVICPDQKGTCPDGSTCCLLNTGKYGCCPLRKAVCCPDHLHCCPNGYKCDTATQRCNKGALSVKWHSKTPATPMAKTAPTPKTMCPGGLTECPPNNTCCQVGTTKGNYGCCPIATAVCCGDRLHCCPANYQCDEAHKFCVHGDTMLPWVPVNMKTAQKRLRKPPKIAAVMGVTAQAGKTPRGAPKRQQTPVKKIESKATKQSVGGTARKVVPPGGRKRSAPASAQVSGAAKNILKSKPLGMKAIAGKQPQKLATSKERLKGRKSVDSKVAGSNRARTQQGKQQASVKGSFAKVIKNQAITTNGETTKREKRNKFRARLPHKGKGSLRGNVRGEATPQRKCVSQTVSRGKAESKSALKLKLLQKKTATHRQVAAPGRGLKTLKTGKASVTKQALDSKSKAAVPKKSIATGRLKDMGKNPAGRKAMKPVSVGTTKSKLSTKSTLKTPAADEKKKVLTSSPKSAAKSQTSKTPPVTKSKLGKKTLKNAPKRQDSTGSWWLPSMVRGLVKKIFSWSRGRHPHVKIGSSIGVTSKKKTGIVCPGGKAKCPTATTCCKLKSGLFGCCPMVEATCCSDHIHCCPKGSKCNLQAGTCDSVVDKTSTRMQKKFSAHSLEGIVVCPGGKATCSSGSTCCKSQSGEYECCPMPKEAFGQAAITARRLFVHISTTVRIARYSFIQLSELAKGSKRLQWDFKPIQSLAF